MNICHVAYAFYESDNRIMRYAETAAARGDHVEVIALRHPGQCRREELHGVRVSRIQRRLRNEKHPLSYFLRILLFSASATLRVSFQHIRRRIDVIHVHSVPDVLVFCAFLPKLLGCRVILDIHDILPEFYASKFGVDESSLAFRFLLLAEKLSTAFADHVIIANHLWHTRLVARAVAPDKCTAIINAPDPAVFRCEGRRRRDGKFVLIYPGSLNEHQGLEVAVRAVAQASTIAPEIELHIYGEGPCKERLIFLARACGIEEKVRFFPLLPLREVAARIENADLGIVPKRADGFGNEAFSTKVLEFMSLGVPVLVTGTRVDHYYFDPSVVTFCESGSEEDFARKLLLLRDDRHLRLAQARRASAFVKKHDWTVYKGIYLDLLSSSRPESRPVAHAPREERQANLSSL